MTTRLSTTHGNKTLKTRGRFSPGNKIGKGTRRRQRRSGGKHKIDDDGGAREVTAARITLSDDKYQVIKSPGDINLNNNPYIYLGRSKNGVYCASIDLKQHQRLQVWQLHELHGGGYHMEWMLIHDVSLDQIMADFRWNPEAVRPWIEHDMYSDDSKNDREISQEESTGWDSEDDSIVYTEDMVGWDMNGHTCILALHPFREIIFLFNKYLDRVWAYHLPNSKFEFLGKLCIGSGEEIGQSFSYTPCWIGDLS
uniref:DUF1618 domain-containing protein n=1 Tax=Oryza nivara TaxID=4536 RepID=A0A0E0IRK1_ORYNI